MHEYQVNYLQRGSSWAWSERSVYPEPVLRVYPTFCLLSQYILFVENHCYVMEESYVMEALIFLWFQLLQNIELYGVKIKIIKPSHGLMKKRPKSRTGCKINLSWFSKKAWSVTAMSAQCLFYPVVDAIKMFIKLQTDSLVAGYIWAEEMSPFCLFSWTLTAVVVCGGV